MTNPYHDETGKFCAKNEMFNACTRLAESGDFEGYFKLRTEFEAINKTIPDYIYKPTLRNLESDAADAFNEMSVLHGQYMNLLKYGEIMDDKNLIDERISLKKQQKLNSLKMDRLRKEINNHPDYLKREEERSLLESKLSEINGISHVWIRNYISDLSPAQYDISFDTSTDEHMIGNYSSVKDKSVIFPKYIIKSVRKFAGQKELNPGKIVVNGYDPETKKYAVYRSINVIPDKSVHATLIAEANNLMISINSVLEKTNTN